LFKFLDRFDTPETRLVEAMVYLKNTLPAEPLLSHIFATADRPMVVKSFGLVANRYAAMALARILGVADSQPPSYPSENRKNPAFRAGDGICRALCSRRCGDRR
jgi:hypothetical protein